MHEQTHLLGGQKGAPLMLLPSAAAAEEACSLLLGSSSAGIAAPIRAAPPSPLSSSLLLDLGCWAEAACPSSPLLSSTIHSPAPRLLGLGLQLLCHSIRHCLPGCTSEILDIISTRLGIPPEELLHSVPMLEWVCGSIDPPSLSLLHMAMQAGHLPLIQSLINWAKLHSVRPDWTVAGPSGICPLHLAALLPNAEAVVRGMLELPRPYGPDIAAAWLLCRSSDGRTPAELGSSVGLPASLDSLAHGLLVRAAEEEGASYATGANPGSLSKSVSSVSDTNGIAAMMTGLMTGEEDGVVASREVTEVPPVDRELWRMPETALARKTETASADKAEGLSAAASGGKAEDLSAAAGDSGGHVGHLSGSNSVNSSMPESEGAPCSNSSPIIFPSYVTGRMEAGHLRGLCRLLLLGFPDRSVERRYAQFKV